MVGDRWQMVHTAWWLNGDRVVKKDAQMCMVDRWWLEK